MEPILTSGDKWGQLINAGSILVTACKSHSPGGQPSEWPLQVHGGLETAGCNATSKQLNPTGTFGEGLNPTVVGGLGEIPEVPTRSGVCTVH